MGALTTEVGEVCLGREFVVHLGNFTSRADIFGLVLACFA
jgi:hypothetical protein